MPATTKSRTEEALEIVVSNLALSLKKSNDNIKRYISEQLPQMYNDLCIQTFTGENDEFEIIKNVQDSTNLILEANSLLAKVEDSEEDNEHSMISPTNLWTEETQPTGIEALAIVLDNNNTDTSNNDMLQKIHMLKFENYYLADKLLNQILQFNLAELKKRYGEWPRDSWNVQSDSKAMAREMTNEIRESNYILNISRVLSMNNTLHTRRCVISLDDGETVVMANGLQNQAANAGIAGVTQTTILSNHANQQG